jgi:4-diphosphocytidyl-2-C-methyl-D-erythritol kinase
MIVFPNCKINLGLRVLHKRSDGFHELETVFYPIAIHDMVEIIPLKEKAGGSNITFSQSGLEIDGGQNNNLCIKAIRLLREKFPQIPSIQMHLHKIIPTGAGLGGGSSNAAFTLELMNKICGLDLSTEQLIQLSSELGSDCPFFIINKPCFSKGRGELLEEIELDLSTYKILLVNPGIHINTKEAFAGITPALPEVSVKDIIKKPIHSWKDELKNDFEKTIFKKYPVIEQIKNKMYSNGALYASMSGTGSTVYGIFSKDQMPGILFPRIIS